MKLKITGSGDRLKVKLTAPFSEIVNGVDFASPVIELAAMAGLTGRNVISQAAGLSPLAVGEVLNNESGAKLSDIERIAKTCVELIQKKG